MGAVDRFVLGHLHPQQPPTGWWFSTTGVEVDSLVPPSGEGRPSRHLHASPNVANLAGKLSRARPGAHPERLITVLATTVAPSRSLHRAHHRRRPPPSPAPAASAAPRLAAPRRRPAARPAAAAAPLIAIARSLPPIATHQPRPERPHRRSRAPYPAEDIIAALQEVVLPSGLRASTRWRRRSSVTVVLESVVDPHNTAGVMHLGRPRHRRGARGRAGTKPLLAKRVT
nr:hypothetical protein [Deltaproteobacteria bacterium]